MCTTPILVHPQSGKKSNQSSRKLVVNRQAWMSSAHTAPDQHRPSSPSQSQQPSLLSCCWRTWFFFQHSIQVAPSHAPRVQGSRLHCASNQAIEDTARYGVGTGLPDSSIGLWGHAPGRLGSAKGSGWILLPPPPPPQPPM